MPDAPRDGFPVVLTADRSLMAGYRILFDGMMLCSQTTAAPASLTRLLLAPPVRSESSRAVQAPLGLRRVEAALLAGGFRADEVAIVATEDLASAVGRATRVVGLSSGDPLGIGMNSTTMAGLVGGEIYTSAWFRALADKVKGLRRGGAGPAVVFGGPGAWQIRSNGDARRAFGIDHVIEGYCEADVARIFRGLCDGKRADPLVRCDGPEAASIPRARGATVMGVVEISRGCGLGCGFCTIGRDPMRHLPAETVVSDVRTNVASGVRDIALISEDLFRYGAKGAESVDPGALRRLLTEVRAIAGVRTIQVDHANISSASRFSDEDLAEVRRLLTGPNRHEFLWLNLGVETADGDLLDANGGGPKMRPFGAAEWGDACRKQVLRLIRAGFFPLVSLVIGMPGETEEHLRRTIAWVEGLARERLAVFPMFCAPIDGKSRPFSAADMRREHWRLFEASYGINFKWIPMLFRDNQAAAGVSWWRRTILQTVGRVETVKWKRRFRKHLR